MQMHVVNAEIEFVKLLFPSSSPRHDIFTDTTDNSAQLRDIRSENRTVDTSQPTASHISTSTFFFLNPPPRYILHDSLRQTPINCTLSSLSISSAAIKPTTKMKLTTVKTPFHHVTHKKEGWFDDIKLDLIAAAVSLNHDLATSSLLKHGNSVLTRYQGEFIGTVCPKVL